MVKGDKPKLNWSNQAFHRLKKIYEEVLQESYTNAEKVRSGIVKIVEQLPSHPGKYPLDKYKKDNPGNYRAFEKYSYRIANKHTDKEIRILRIRHVKQEPKTH